uniref:glucuronosyltransferase n=1 Tax=Panagrellus redivivus TaxID=6233 RepID=A0A7E4WBG5_PANRE
MFIVIISLIAVALCNVGNAANVVAINPYFAHSHFAFMVKLIDILADEGHNMTMIIPSLDTSKHAPMPKKARIIIRSEYSTTSTLKDGIDQGFWDDGSEIWKTRQMAAQFTTELLRQCEDFLSDKSFIDSMKAENFDMAMIEPTDFCGYGFLKQINVTAFVNIVPMALSEKHALANGLPGRNFEAFPTTNDYHPGLTYTERLLNYVHPIIRHFLHGHYDSGISSNVVQKYVDPNFHQDQAIGGARFTFLNTEEHMDFPRPIRWHHCVQ